MDEVRKALTNGEDVVLPIHTAELSGKVRIHRDGRMITMREDGTLSVQCVWMIWDFMAWNNNTLQRQAVKILQNELWIEPRTEG